MEVGSPKQCVLLSSWFDIHGLPGTDGTTGSEILGLKTVLLYMLTTLDILVEDFSRYNDNIHDEDVVEI